MTESNVPRYNIPEGIWKALLLTFFHKSMLNSSSRRNMLSLISVTVPQKENGSERMVRTPQYPRRVEEKLSESHAEEYIKVEKETEKEKKKETNLTSKYQPTDQHRRHQAQGASPLAEAPRPSPARLMASVRSLVQLSSLRARP